MRKFSLLFRFSDFACMKLDNYSVFLLLPPAAAAREEEAGTRSCISQMRGPAPRQGAWLAPWNPKLNSY
jgi:hypothetical protein